MKDVSKCQPFSDCVPGAKKKKHEKQKVWQSSGTWHRICSITGHKRNITDIKNEERRSLPRQGMKTAETKV